MKPINIPAPGPGLWTFLILSLIVWSLLGCTRLEAQQALTTCNPSRTICATRVLTPPEPTPAPQVHEWPRSPSGGTPEPRKPYLEWPTREPRPGSKVVTVEVAP